jgi:hypothetical protein
MTEADIIARLEAAGATLLALRTGAIGPSEPRSGLPEPVREVSASYGWSQATTRPAIPAAADIDRMDEALSWVMFIPADKFVLRRIINARSLTSPTNGRHLYTWSAIARLIGCDRRAVQRWHAQGIGIIARGLGRGYRPENGLGGSRLPPRARPASGGFSVASSGMRL